MAVDERAGVRVYEAQPGRVLFGTGAADRLAGELDRLGATRAVVIAGKARADETVERLAPRVVATMTEIAQHVPVALAVRARRLAASVRADVLVAVGGGSAIGLAKAVALESGVPIVAVPTTYSGSELTTIYGLTEGGAKRTGHDQRVLPAVVVYDPALTVGLPASVTGPSGMNSLAHGVEALYGPSANPLTCALAEAGIRALAAGLPVAVEDPADLAGRTESLRGAWLAGAALAGAGTGFHHQICHALGGAFRLDHGGMHAVVLPYAVGFVTPAVPGEMARVAACLGTADAATGCWELARSLGTPASLAELGLAEADLERAAELCAGRVAQHPRPSTVADLLALLRAAYAGRVPEQDSMR